MTEVKLGQGAPAAPPATQPAPEPKAQDKPAATAPAEPVDLEKLGNPNANPSSKGQSK
jgi:hypothetical protein